MKRNKQGVASTMREIREILRLSFLGLSQRQIARSLKRSKTLIQRVVEKGNHSNLFMKTLDSLSDEELKNKLDFHPEKRVKVKNKAKIDFNNIYLELTKHKTVTLQLLWEEYKEKNPESYYSYSFFCDQFKEWKKPLNVTLRKHYKAGEYLFVDFSGKKISYYDVESKSQKEAEVFVASLGCSNYTYVQACESQKLKDWIEIHQKTFEFFSGVPQIIVPDNLKSGVTKPHKIDPDINPTYFEMAKHYNCAILPARSRKPKDKAKVENSVLIAQRWIFACLRKRQFFSIEEINEAIDELLIKFNQKKFQKLEGSRESLFLEIEKKELLPMPQNRFEYCEFSLAKVNIDYHIHFEKNHYSVPYHIVGKQVTIRSTINCIEVFYNNQRIASHKRSYKKFHYITNEVHRPKKHEFLKWNPQRLRNWARSVGPKTFLLIDKCFKSKVNEDVGIKNCLGILNLSKKATDQVLEMACEEALPMGTTRFKHLNRILNEILKKQIDPEMLKNREAQNHGNVRGSSYYDFSEKEIN